MCHWKISQIFFQQKCLEADGKPLKIVFPLNFFHVKIKNLKREQAYDSENKVMGDKLLLNSCAKFQRWIHMWNYGKIAKTMLRLYQMASRFQDSTNEDVRAFKDNKEYLNTPKRTNFINKDSSGYFRKKFWKFWIFNVCFKLFSTWSFRYEQVKTHDKRYCHPWHKQVIHWWNQEMISPAFCQNPYNFTRHHFFTHTNIIICHNNKENCFGRLTSRSCGLMSCIKPR